MNADRLAKHLKELGVAAVAATTFENIYYLTGISSVPLTMFPHSGHSFVIVTQERPGEPFFISSRCEVDQFLDSDPATIGALGYGTFYRELPANVELSERESRLRNVAVDGPAATDPVEALVMALSQLGLSGARVALDEDGISTHLLSAVRAALPNVDFVLGADILRWTRKVKTEDEITQLAKAAAAGEAGLKAVLGIAQVGLTERDAVREFNRAVVSLDGQPKFTLIKFGRNGVAGQTRPSDRPLSKGDTIWFDVGGVVEGYWFDIARTCSLGEPTAKVRKYYEAILAGEERAIAEAKPGMSGGELFDLTVEAVRESGVQHYRRNHVGHGIGVESYDRVLISPGNTDRLEEGAVVNIETPYYEFGLGAIQVEDPFVVRKKGNELLTSLTRQFTVIQ